MRSAQADQESLDDRGLPDARLARHEHDLPPPALAPCKRVGEPADLGVSPDDRSRGRPRGCAKRRRRRLPRRDRADETKPPAMHGLDESRPTRIVAEDTADLL